MKRVTLALTIPSSLFKSYTKDLSTPIFELVSVSTPSIFVSRQDCDYVMIVDIPEGMSIVFHDKIWGSCNVEIFSSMDSGLEAFSRNPARGSFAAMTFQSTALPIT